MLLCLVSLVPCLIASPVYPLRLVDVSRSIINEVGSVFGPQFKTSRGTFLNISDNMITSAGLSRILSSYAYSVGPLQLVAERNAINDLPQRFLGSFGSNVARGGLLELYISENPISTISPDVFTGASVSTAFINMSYSTMTSVNFPKQFNFADAPSFRSNQGQAELSFIAAGVGATPQVATAFNQFLLPHTCNSFGLNCTGGCGPSCNLTLSLRDNGITNVETDAFTNARVTVLDLSRNQMTSIASNSFGATSYLHHLDLSDNRLTILPYGIVANASNLRLLNIKNNAIAVMPIGDQQIRSPENAEGNVLTCETYFPYSKDCACRQPYSLSTHCGYLRCTATIDGCPERTVLNDSNCQYGPWSSCVNPATVLGHQYYSESTKSFLHVSQCESRFPDPDGGYRPAYM